MVAALRHRPIADENVRCHSSHHRRGVGSVKSRQQFPPQAPDRTAETVALVVAVAFSALLAYVAFQDFRLGRDLSYFAPIAVVGLSQIFIALVAWFFLRRRRLRAGDSKLRLYEGLRNL